MGLFDRFKKGKKKESKQAKNSVQEKPLDDIKIEEIIPEVPLTGKTCERCGGDIVRGNKVTLAGKPFHKWCLRKVRKEAKQGKYKI